MKQLLALVAVPEGEVIEYLRNIYMTKFIRRPHCYSFDCDPDLNSQSRNDAPCHTMVAALLGK